MGEEKKLSPKHARLILIVLAVYVIALAVLAADQVLELGLWPPPLDRQLAANVDALAADTVPLDERQRAFEELVAYHEFSVPHLIEGLERNDPAPAQPAAQCLALIAMRFFRASQEQVASYGSDSARWRAWWWATRAKLERRAS